MDLLRVDLQIKVWQSQEWNSLLCTLANMIQIEECQLSLCICHPLCLVCVQGWPQSLPCRRRSLPVRGPLQHESWDQELTTWWLSLPSTLTVWETLFLLSNEPVSNNEGCECQLIVMSNLIQPWFFFSPPKGSLPGVSSLRLVQAGFFTLSVSWDQPASPVQGYRLTYGPRGQTHTSFSVCLSLA